MEKERRIGFYPEPKLLRQIRRIVKPEITPKGSQEYLDSPSKRVLDISAGLVGLIPNAPLIMIAVAINKLTDPKEPAFYKAEKRVTKGGKEIPIFKIRSMRSANTGETFFDQTDPKRTNWFGRFLRRTSIDELPQLLDILRGDMSVVGPRIMPTREFKDFKEKLPRDVYEKWERSYLSCQPGVTGLAQIMGNKDLSPHQRARLDYFYITHANLGLDLYIIFSTFFALIRGRGIR